MSLNTKPKIEIYDMMRKETRKKLDRLLLLQRLKWIGGSVLGLAVTAGIFWDSGLDAAVETHRVTGVVDQVSPLTGLSANDMEKGLAVDVKLDGGSKVRVIVLKTTNPHVGDHIAVMEHRHGTGRTTFSWN